MEIILVPGMGGFVTNMEYKYTVKYVYPASPFQACENCGKMITWAACLLERKTGKHLQTGVDCAATLADRYTTNQGFKASKAITHLKKKYGKLCNN